TPRSARGIAGCRSAVGKRRNRTVSRSSGTLSIRPLLDHLAHVERQRGGERRLGWSRLRPGEGARGLCELQLAAAHELRPEQLERPPLALLAAGHPRTLDHRQRTLERSRLAVATPQERRRR